MPYWLEIHCDAAQDDGQPARANDDECRSYSNSNPGIMTWRQTGAFARLHETARGQGWVRRSLRWLCPRCAAKGRKVLT